MKIGSISGVVYGVRDLDKTAEFPRRPGGRPGCRQLQLARRSRWRHLDAGIDANRRNRDPRSVTFPPRGGS